MNKSMKYSIIAGILIIYGFVVGFIPLQIWKGDRHFTNSVIEINHLHAVIHRIFIWILPTLAGTMILYYLIVYKKYMNYLIGELYIVPIVYIFSSSLTFIVIFIGPFISEFRYNLKGYTESSLDIDFLIVHLIDALSFIIGCVYIYIFIKVVKLHNELHSAKSLDDQKNNSNS